MSVLDDIGNYEEWQEFLTYKREKNHISKEEESSIEKFIWDKRYVCYYNMIKEGGFPRDYPTRKIINKEGSKKKRVVYSFSAEENIVLKFIAYKLYIFDDVFSKSCYAFRRRYGAGDAVRHFRGNGKYGRKYCFKGDISNYFNSINIDILIKKLGFLRERDNELYRLFERILREDRVYANGKVIRDNHGAMAGIPISPFFANIYLADMDKWFWEKDIPYFRYSDDILIFADTEKELKGRTEVFYQMIKENCLTVNEDKVTVTEPGEIWEFLGFSYNNGRIDLSENTKKKIKAKIKRKADALRRWQRKKGLTPDKAAIGFINAMNRKFYGRDETAEDTDEFTWSRWFFPNITEDTSLKEIDIYMQDYIRYIITGRHYKGNYRITYDTIKSWGYRSLVYEYYRGKKEKEHGR